MIPIPSPKPFLSITNSRIDHPSLRADSINLLRNRTHPLCWQQICVHYRTPEHYVSLSINLINYSIGTGRKHKLSIISLPIIELAVRLNDLCSFDVMCTAHRHTYTQGGHTLCDTHTHTHTHETYIRKDRAVRC